MKTQFLTIYWREMVRYLRFRALLFSSLGRPVLWLLLFGVAMTSSMPEISTDTITYQSYITVGIMAMTALFTSLFGGIGLLFDKNYGLLKEIVASPATKTHIIIGQGLSGLTKSLIQVIIIMAVGTALGGVIFRHGPVLLMVANVLLAFVLVALFSLGFIFMSAAIAVKLRSFEGLQAIMTMLTMPLFFASGALYSTANFPTWLKMIAYLNPLNYLIRGLQILAFGNEFSIMETFYDYSLWDLGFCFLYLGVFAALMLTVSLISFKNAEVT